MHLWLEWLLVLFGIGTSVGLGIQMYRKQLPWKSSQFKSMRLTSVYVIGANLVNLTVLANPQAYHGEIARFVVMLLLSIPISFITSYVVAQISYLCARRIYMASRK